MSEDNRAIFSCSIVSITEAPLSPRDISTYAPLIAHATGIRGSYAKNMNASNFIGGGGASYVGKRDAYV